MINDNHKGIISTPLDSYLNHKKFDNEEEGNEEEEWVLLFDGSVVTSATVRE